MRNLIHDLVSWCFGKRITNLKRYYNLLSENRKLKRDLQKKIDTLNEIAEIHANIALICEAQQETINYIAHKQFNNISYN